MRGFWIAVLVLTSSPASVMGQRAARPACPDPGPGSREALAGVWVQDDMGPVLTYSRRYQFDPDGTFTFAFTSRPSGSMDETLLARRQGRYEIRDGCLVMSPRGDSTAVRAWRIERDPYVGDIQLVFLKPDGGRDIYYRK